MKKKIVALMLGVMIVMAVAGCGGNDKDNKGAEATETVESTEHTADTPSASGAFDLKGSDYAKLCDYSAVAVTITGDYEVEDQDVLDYFEQMFNSYGPFYKADSDKTTIGEGDIVNVDYVGKLDGVEFDGGAAKGENIDVYKNASTSGNTYIEGFTEGLKGVSVGDVIDCDVTFPENYGNADLAGKDVVFTFTVNSIQKEMEIGDVDDTFAKEQFQVDTVDAMYADIRSYMDNNAAYNKQYDTYTAVQNYLIDNSTVEVPEDYLAARVSDYKRQFVEQYCGGDETQLEAYVSEYYGKTAEEMEASWKEGMDKSIRLELIMDAIAEEMGIELNEEEFDTYVTKMVSNNGYESAEAMYKLYGYGDTAYGERYFKDLYTYDKALEKILETAEVTVDPAAVPETDGTEEANPAEGTEETAEGTEKADVTEAE